jgi:hypothetical protein
MPSQVNIFMNPSKKKYSANKSRCFLFVYEAHHVELAGCDVANTYILRLVPSQENVFYETHLICRFFINQ